MRLAFKIIIGVVIALIAVFAILIAVVFVVGMNAMSQIDGEFIEIAREYGELNDARIVDNSNPDGERNQERMVTPTTIEPTPP